MLREKFKKYLPKIYNRIKTYYAFQSLKNEYFYDLKRYFEYSDYFYNDSEQKCIMRIMHRYHPIEKGLTMPEMRYGFGKDNISSLIEDCLKYKNQYLPIAFQNKTAGYQQYNHAIGVLLEYKNAHEDIGYELDVDFVKNLNLLIKGTDSYLSCKQIQTTKEKYFASSTSPFIEFSKSRHSVRNFKGDIKPEIIFKAIELAQNTPSACNRQPTRVHIIENEELKNKLLDLQGGNRGFGYLANKVLILTTELVGYRSVSERNYPFVDGGMYAMNLLFALHYYKIGACALNWCYTAEKDTYLWKILNIPETQTVIMMIACGGVPENFKVTLSKKSSAESVIVQHQ